MECRSGRTCNQSASWSLSAAVHTGLNRGLDFRLRVKAEVLLLAQRRNVGSTAAYFHLTLLLALASTVQSLNGKMGHLAHCGA
jgi:hypothetical protein